MYARIVPGTIEPSMTMRRLRNSSRCSSSVASSPWSRRRGSLAIVALGGRVVLGGRGRRLGGRELGGRVRRIAGDRVLELAHPRSERATHLRQPLRAEEEQDDSKQDGDMCRLGETHEYGESSAS